MRNTGGSVRLGANSALLQDLLRGECGFDGYVISDYFANLAVFAE